ncbi:multidrug resistance protein fnx1 [Xylaria bambusicola]|uniref:multidrug resistance protein fnx1 n=1 Tax=Xylaria bambusicola TaxID=326684 RepID=UPI0020072EAD|nr:multidrug resistance protein fnx1 [Xylaria bambusicola]KAI0506913.1 multidrug resistance protein fnx1 [Xylaria bambusicola]
MVLEDEKAADLERGAGLAHAEEKPATPTSTNDDLNATGRDAEKPAEGLDGTPKEVKAVEQDGATTTQPTDADDLPNGGRSGLEMTVIMVALCTALFLAALDITIITTALPTIVGEFNSSSGYTWIGAAYTLASSATVPSWGKVSDIWGRKPVLLVAVGIFWIGSLIAALSKSIGQLIAARAIQGAGGGGIVVLINIAVSDLVSVRQRGQYYGIFGAVWALASAIGPILGGVFTSKVTWRWCFWINLPFSGLGFVILFFVLKLHNPRTPVRQGLAAIDWLGSVLIIGATLQLLFGLEFGGVTYPWKSVPVIALIVFSIVTFGVAILVEKYVAEYPVIPLRLFKSRRNLAAFAICFVHGLVFISGSYYLPLYFQAVVGASSLLSGAYSLAYALSLSFISTGTGIWMKNTGQYLPPIVFGMLFLTLGFGLFIDLGSHVNWAKLVIYQIVAGIGVGPNFQSPLIALHSGLEPRDIAAGTSTFQFIRQLGTSISIVIGGVVIQNAMEKQYPSLVAELGPELAGQLSGGNAAANVGLVASLTGEQGRVARDAFWNSLREMFIVFTVISAVGLLVSPFVGRRKLSKQHTEHKTGLHNLAKRGNQESQSEPTSEGEKST